MSKVKKEELNLRTAVHGEFMRCAMDPVHFFKKYAKIQHPIKGKILFELYPFQEDTLRDLRDHRFNIILKSRQMGISTLVAGYALHNLMFQDDFKVLVIATTQEVAKNLVQKVQIMFEFLPSFLKSGLQIVNNNKLSLTFSNGSSIKAVSSSPDAARSEALSLLIIDEAAFIETFDQIWTSAQMTLSTGGKAVVLSTPNGQGNLFHSLWQRAEEGRVEEGLDKFNPIQLKWDLHPEREQKWRDQQDALLGKRQAAQECFDGETKILTEIGYRNIKDIKVGDLVYTHTGQLQPVIRTMSHISDNCITIHTNKNKLKHSVVTKNHPFLVEGNWIPVGEIPNKTKLNRLPTFQINKAPSCLNLYEICKPKFFKKLLTSDGNQFYINDRRHKTLHNSNIVLDYDVGYLIGLYLAEGSKCRLRTTYSCNAETELEQWTTDLSKIIIDKFGNLELKTRLTEGKSGQISISSAVFSEFISYFVEGTDSKTKHLTEQYYKLASFEFLKGTLEGYLQGDGCLIEKYVKMASSISKSLIYDIKCIAELLNFGNVCVSISRPAGTAVFRNTTYKTNETYKVWFSRTKNVAYSVDNLYQSMDSILQMDTTSKTETVYNLEVAEDHTYITEHGVVHNCDCSFLTSGHTVLDSDILLHYKDHENICEPIEKRGIGGDLWIWKYPDPLRDYIVTADPARGDGEDYSALHIVDVETVEQVAEFKGKIDTQAFGRMCVSLATEYNNALLIIENKNIGWSTVQVALDLNYTNLYYSYKNDPFLDENIHLRKHYDLVDKENMVPGLTTTTRIRPVLISKLEMYFREHVPVIHSRRLINELFTFMWVDGKPQASKGYNDDLVMAFTFALYIRDTALRMRQMGIELTKQSVSHTFKTVYKPSYTDNGQWSIPVGPAGNKEKLTWLL